MNEKHITTKISSVMYSLNRTIKSRTLCMLLFYGAAAGKHDHVLMLVALTLDENGLVIVEILKDFARTANNRGQWIVSDVHRKSGLT